MSFSPAVFATLQLGAGIAQSISQVHESEIKAIEQESAAGAELFNANLAREEAKLARAKAKIEVARQRRSRDKLISQQQTLYAISGVRVDVGTPLIVMQDTYEELELDILITQLNADIEAQRLESEARQAEIRASQRRVSAAQERVGGRMRAGATLLETAAEFGKKFIEEKDKING